MTVPKPGGSKLATTIAETSLIPIYLSGDSAQPAMVALSALRTELFDIDLGTVADPAALTAATLTDSSGGSADTTIAAITNANNAGSADVTPTANAIADLAAQHNALLVDVTDIRTVLLNLVNALQAVGLVDAV